VQRKFRCALAPLDTEWFLPVGAVHSGTDFQPLRVELVGAGSLDGVGRGRVAIDMIFESECFRSQSIGFSCQALSCYNQSRPGIWNSTRNMLVRRGLKSQSAGSRNLNPVPMKPVSWEEIKLKLNREL